MFYNCKKLKMLDLSSFNTNNMRSMQHFVDNCVSLKFIDLSSFHYDCTVYVGPFYGNGTMIVRKEFYEHLSNKPSNWRIIFTD